MRKTVRRWLIERYYDFKDRWFPEPVGEAKSAELSDSGKVMLLPPDKPKPTPSVRDSANVLKGSLRDRINKSRC